MYPEKCKIHLWGWLWDSIEFRSDFWFVSPFVCLVLQNVVYKYLSCQSLQFKSIYIINYHFFRRGWDVCFGGTKFRSYFLSPFSGFSFTKCCLQNVVYLYYLIYK